MKNERIFYTVNSYRWNESSTQHDIKGYWRTTGSGPGGHTLEEAYARVRQDIIRIHPSDLDKVRFTIEKIVQTNEVVEEFSRSDLTMFMLKTS